MKKALLKPDFISEEELNALMYNTAEAWLGIQTNGDDWGIQSLLESAGVWDWWKNQWQITDAAFAKEHAEYLQLNDQESRTLLESLYREFHSAEGISLRMGRKVLDEAYNLLLSKMWHERQADSARQLK